MTKPDIPAAVLQFIAKKLDTVPELETLLIMSAEESRSWTAEEIAARTYVPPSNALLVLEALRRRQLVTLDGDATHFQFNPASDEERQLVAQTAIAYRHHLVSIATYIH